MARPILLKTSRKVALVGNPNSGKSTLFNALTGLRQKVANYPGVTVDRKTGTCPTPLGDVELIDLPGTYSLVSRSPDERVAVDFLSGKLGEFGAVAAQPDAVIVVVDASNLPRNLFLLTQVMEMRLPVLVALTMTDLAGKQRRAVDAQKLSRLLGGVPVVEVVAQQGKGVEELRQQIQNAAVCSEPDWPLPPTFVDAIEVLRPLIRPYAQASRISDRALAEHAIVGDDVIELPEELKAAVAQQRSRIVDIGLDPMQCDIEAHYDWIDGVVEQVVEQVDEESAVRSPGRSPSAAPGQFAAKPVRSRLTLPMIPDRPSDKLTRRLDAVLLHRLFGPLAFAVIMALLFMSIFLLADPLIGVIESGIGLLSDLVTGSMAQGPLKALLADGIFAGVGGVIVFVPQIAILFLFLAVLEDSGYLARGAFIMDRIFSRVGLSGKSFVPLLSSFACAIPGIMSARSIEDRQTRLATICVAPFMSCSARLPVYGLLIGTFFAGLSVFGRGMVMFACYALGVVVAFATAFVFRKTLLKGGHAGTFMLEMPTYRRPSIRNVLRTVWTNTRQFLVKAGTIIFALSIILWALTYFPRMPLENVEAVRASVTNTSSVEADQETAEAQAQLAYSFAGRFGHLIEPVIAPLGYDWKIGVGLVGAFAAREVFVGTLGTIYAAADAEDDSSTLQQSILADTRADGTPVWNTAVAVSLLVWFVLAMQCLSTVAIVKRETGTWSWPIFLTIYMNAVAYVGAFIAYRTAILFM